MRTIHPDVIAELAKPVIRSIYLVRLELDEEVVAFHSAHGIISFEGYDYYGLGALGNVSNTSENVNLDPQSCEISLSGIKTDVLDAVVNTQYINRPAICHIALLDESHQIIGEPITYFKGKIDGESVSFNKTVAITVSVRDRLADWSRPSVERYTDQDQRGRHPGDKGFEFVTAIASKEITWPARQWFENNQ